jgi:hypothetical protein
MGTMDDAADRTPHSGGRRDASESDFDVAV